MKSIPSNFFRFHIVKTYFYTNLSFRLVETYFLSSGNSMLLFRASFLMLKSIIEIRGNQFLKKSIFFLVETIFFDFLARRSGYFRIVEKYFSTNASFRVVKRDFLASANHFLYFFQRLLPEKAFFLSNGNEFLNESFIPAIGEGFSSLMETVTLLESFFLLAEN